jgi:hypothetical protein
MLMEAVKAFLEVAGAVGLAILILVVINMKFRKPWR